MSDSPTVIHVVARAGIPNQIDVLTPGPPGPAGTEWQVGTTVPAPSLGGIGDYYLRSNGDVYGPKTSNGWGTVIFSITPPIPTAQQVGADPVGTAAAAITAHLQAKDHLTPQQAAAAAPVQSVSAITVPSGWTSTSSIASGNVSLSIGLPTGFSLLAAADKTAWNAASVLASTAVQPAALLSALAAKADLVNGLVPANQIPPISVTPASIGAATVAQASSLSSRLDAFRDARTFYVSKRISAGDSNNGTSPGEPFLTIQAAKAAANAFIAANPTEFAVVEIGPGTYEEANLPIRWTKNILVKSVKQRTVRVKPAAGQEFNSIFAVDSGNMICDITFCGHQAQNTSPLDSSVGTRAWAITFNEQANNGQGVILHASPYIKDCLSLTAEDDTGIAGSTSTGDCGGGVEVDGAKCHPNSPLRSMVVYGFTQQNLGGPGAVVKNDGYGEFVSFFGLFGTWHVQCETGGQATLSGGGCSEFGTYGLVADGYSPTPLYTGSLRVAATAGSTTIDVVGMTSNRLGTSSRPAAGQIAIVGGSVYIVTSSVPIDASGAVVADSAPSRAGYRVNFYNESGVGLSGNLSQGATADFRLRSQISCGTHSANYVGSGNNYSALPWNGGVPIRGNEAVERNHGRIFGLIVNDIGDIKVAGGAFSVDGTTGAVTINTSQFNLSGLNAIGPFSRNGGVSSVGVQLQELSNNPTLLNSLGVTGADTAATQFAIRSFVDNKFITGITRTAGQPITITDTSTQDSNGFWARTRNIELSLNQPNGLVQLTGAGIVPSNLISLSKSDVGLGNVDNTSDVNKPVSTAQAAADTAVAQAAAADATSKASAARDFAVQRGNHTGQQAASTISDFASAATSALSSALAGKADLDVGGKVPAAQLPGFVDDVLEFSSIATFPATGETGKLYISLATNRQYRWSGSVYIEINPSPGSTDGVPEGSVNLYFTTARGETAAASWWSGSASKTKLDGIASGATANATDAQLRDRQTHTGQQAASTISDLTTTVRGLFSASGLSYDSSTGVFSYTAPTLVSLGAEAYYPIRQTLTAVSGTYTIDVTTSKEFVTGAAINGATTINLSGLGSIPTNGVWRGVLRFSYTSGAISWFAGNSGYTVKWDGGTAMTPTAGESEAVIIEVVGGQTVIEIAAMKGRT